MSKLLYTLLGAAVGAGVTYLAIGDKSLINNLSDLTDETESVLSEFDNSWSEVTTTEVTDAAETA